jgi:hypothetical protein
MSAPLVFVKTVKAINSGEMIHRLIREDKEFHFQNWFENRLKETELYYERGGRNSYPDFRMVGTTEGYEVKGLAYPGREADFDSNSQVPSGIHNGRTIYYVFGRYPSEPDGDTYPVLDLVICHGDFLNANHEYVHENKSFRGFGSYGDILIRDRKMYVVPTPFRIVEGIAHNHTLILPTEIDLKDEFLKVGELVRRETDELVVGYSFDLLKNEIRITKAPNPFKGNEHKFKAWRLQGSNSSPVKLKTTSNTRFNFKDE